MISVAARFLPGMIASVMLLTGTDKAHAVSPEWEESGQASWYGSWHQGRRTSSGQPFDQNAMTAAHSNLPLGSRVRVTLQHTGESVVVTINDRQPPKRLRVIDLSHGAASRLGMVSRGIAMVRLAPADEPVEVAEAPEEGSIRRTWKDRVAATTALSAPHLSAPASAGPTPAVPALPSLAPNTRVSPRRRGRLHTRPGRPSGAAGHPCCRAPSAVRVRHSAQRRAALHRP